MNKLISVFFLVPTILFFACTEEYLNEFISQRHPVVVDYDLPLAKMIAAGKYERLDGDITIGYVVKKRGKENVDIIVKRFGDRISTEDAIKAFDTLGLRPASLEELLAFGAKYPEAPCNYSFLALGSKIGCPFVDLRGFGGKCFMWDSVAVCLNGLGWHGLGFCKGHSWNGRCCFLTVRK